MMRIPANHPLRKLFNHFVQSRFIKDALVHDSAVSEYVAGILTDFTHVDNLYRIRNARGKRLEDVAEMLVESNPMLEASSFDREREVRKHIGDYTLFFTGMFPEHLGSRARRRQAPLDSLIDYVKTGKESYAIVSEFNVFEYEREAPLFRRLSENFEQCVYGLNLVKRDLLRLQHGYYRQIENILNA